MPPKRYRTWLDPPCDGDSEPVYIPRSTDYYNKTDHEQPRVRLSPVNAELEGNVAVHADVNVEEAESPIVQQDEDYNVICTGPQETREVEHGSEAYSVPSRSTPVDFSSSHPSKRCQEESYDSSCSSSPQSLDYILPEAAPTRSHVAAVDHMEEYEEEADAEDDDEDDDSFSILDHIIDAIRYRGSEHSIGSESEGIDELSPRLEVAAAHAEGPVFEAFHTQNHEGAEATSMEADHPDCLNANTEDIGVDQSYMESQENQEVHSQSSISAQSIESEEALTFSDQSDSNNSDEENVPSQQDLFPFPPEVNNQPEEHNIQDNEDSISGGNDEPEIMNPGDDELPQAEIFEALKQNLQGSYRDTIKEAPQISRGELLLNTLFLSNHYHLNFTQLEGIMKLLNSVFMKEILPDTRYKLDQLLKSFQGFDFHFVCSSCLNYLGSLDHSVIKQVNCDVCLKENTISDLNKALFFVIFNLPSQLEVLLADKKIAYSLKNPFDLKNHQTPRIMRDLYDGDMYQSFISSLQHEPDVRNFSCCMSVDGASLYSSSNCEIWPLFCSILELSPHMRMHNLLLGGLWFGNQKPKMDIFLKPFIDNFNQYSSRGFQITIDNQVWSMKGHLLCCCADAPARASVQCVHQHNGSFGCNWCLHPGDNRKYTVLNYNPPRRSREELISDGKAALEMNHPKASVNGVLGISPCHLSTTLNIALGLILEYFHNTNHGIAKQLINAWLGDDGCDEKIIPYYIGRPIKKEMIDKLLTCIQPPVEVRRSPRKISECEHWKGREYENFILYYSVPVLMNILPARYLKHWCLFVQALHLLLQEEITELHIHLAQKLLDRFVVETQELYGEHHMTYNMHISVHLPENVTRWGPLWAINGYCFEDGNKSVKSTIHANRGIASQVCRSLCHSSAIQVLKARCCTPSTQKFQDEIDKKTVSKCIAIGEHEKYIGKTQTFNPSAEERWICLQNGVDLSSFFQVEKLIYHGCVYSTLNNTARKTNNSVALLQNNDHVLIQKIIVSEQSVKGFLLCKRIRVSPHSVPTGVNPADAFLKTTVLFEEELMILPPCELKIVCARITLPHGDFIVKVPNIFNTC